MFQNFSYAPFIKVRPSELDGIGHLPGPDKDRLLPVIGLRRWRGAKKFESVTKRLDQVLGNRPAFVYPCVPDKLDCDAEHELQRLRGSVGGYARWVEFLDANPQFWPTILSADESSEETLAGALSLVELGRPLSFQLSRLREWQPDFLATLSRVNFRGAPVLAVLDFGQLQAGTNIPLAAATLVGLVRTCLERLPTADLAFMFAASSFPLEFASIDRESARLPIRERQLFELVSDQLAGEAQLVYGDYASVYAGVRGFARGGAPRVDFPTKTRWIYYRKDTGTFADAALSVVGDEAWDEDLLIWGTERIRQAAGGNLEGLGYPQAWTTVRIHLHIHQQVHFGGLAGAQYETDEVWQD